MTFRFLGLVPAIALLAVGGAHAQSTTGGGGGMAYPDPLPSGKVTVTAPTARDTGSMAYPASSGGVAGQTPPGRDVGSMAPAATSGVVTTRAGRQPMTRRMAPAAATAAPAPAPTASGMAAARSLETTPGSAPVPYTDFTPAPARGGRAAMMHKAAAPHAVKKVVAKPMTPAPAKPATPAAAAPAPAPAAPAAKPATPAPTK